MSKNYTFYNKIIIVGTINSKNKIIINLLYRQHELSGLGSFYTIRAVNSAVIESEHQKKGTNKNYSFD